MFCFHRFCCLLIVAFTWPACGGCVAIYTKKPIDVLVLDAETCQPISEASLGVSYGPKGIDLSWPLTFNKPDDTVVTTNVHGQAEIPVANFGSIHWSVGAAGYLGRTEMILGDSRVPGEFQPDADGDLDHKAVIRIYRQPAPTISIVVPDGYRGPLLIENRPVEKWIQGKPGQRDFVFHANENGYVGIDATPLLLGDYSSWVSIHVRYENGQGIPESHESIGDDGLALRWLTCVGHEKGIYVVGTESDVQKLHPIIYDYIDGDRTHVSHDHEAINRLFAGARN